MLIVELPRPVQPVWSPTATVPSPFAPTGRRRVATGGAARPRGGPTRNPWKADEENRSRFFSFFAPAGRRRLVERRTDNDARHLFPDTHAHGSAARSGDSSAPLGRTQRKTNWSRGCEPFPRVAHRPQNSGRCFTRGYTPWPRWGRRDHDRNNAAVGCCRFPARTSAAAAPRIGVKREPCFRPGARQCLTALDEDEVDL